jgi:HSP20 family protein
MSILPDDWSDIFWPFAQRSRYSKGFNYFDEIFRGFDEMRSDMEREFEESFKDLESRIPRDLIRGDLIPRGGKITEAESIAYRYSIVIGQHGKSRVKQFGNVKTRLGRGHYAQAPTLSAERELMSDVNITDKEVKIVIELPGVSKKNIKISAYDGAVEVTTADTNRKYREVINIPPEIDLETASSSFNNGILEIRFKKKEQKKNQRKGNQNRLKAQ